MLLKNFEPENDTLDRRILYEITRVRLNEDEFKDADSSDSSQEPPDKNATTQGITISPQKVEEVNSNVLMVNETFYSDEEEESSVWTYLWVLGKNLTKNRLRGFAMSHF